MLLRHRKINDSLLLVRLPVAAKACEGPSALDAKLAARMEWMRERGIRINLKESERPRRTIKPPLPGTVIPFSSEPSVEA